MTTDDSIEDGVLLVPDMQHRPDLACELASPKPPETVDDGIDVYSSDDLHVRDVAVTMPHDPYAVVSVLGFASEDGHTPAVRLACNDPYKPLTAGLEDQELEKDSDAVVTLTRKWVRLLDEAG